MNLQQAHNTAKVLLNGKKSIKTEWGMKTIEGITEMLADKDYEGFTNLETFIISQQIHNKTVVKQLTFFKMVKAVKTQTRDKGEFDSLEQAIKFHLADELKAYFEKALDLRFSPASWLSDLAKAALGRVNWDELASELIQRGKDSV